MTGKLYIDGIDIFTEYGVFITEGGYNGLVSAPTLKEIKYNDWAEEDGIEADLSNPVLDTKEFAISFGCLNNIKTEDFLAFLSDGAYHNFDLREISVTRRLRLVSQPNKRTIGTLEAFTLQFADDFPLDGYSYLAPINAIRQSGYEIDDKPLANYGVWVLDGSYDEIMRIPPVKKNLILNYRNDKGAVYDDVWVNYQAKDVALKCCLRATSIGVFWRNYNALIYDLTQPNERQFYVAMANDIFPCFYKSCSVNEFAIVNNDIWCEFTLTLVFTDFRPKLTIPILGTEDMRVLGTEDKCAIVIEKNYG